MRNLVPPSYLSREELLFTLSGGGIGKQWWSALLLVSFTISQAGASALQMSLPFKRGL